LMHSRQMMQLAPLTSELKEQYKDDPQQLNVRTMALYKEYGLNPVAGCAPALVQMPLFLTVYQCMLLYQFEFQKGTFLWINPAANAATRGFLGANLGQLDPILIVIYGASMIVSSLLTPVNDPAQRKQQRMIGVGAAVVFTIMMFTGLFPVVAGFVLYWTFTNIFSTLQSLRAYRMPLPPPKKVNAPSGGVFPMDAVRPGGLFGGAGSPAVADGKVSNKNGKTGKPAQHRPKKRSK
ncbi:membrane protein insertase YidC, partial [bacterium]